MTIFMNSLKYNFTNIQAIKGFTPVTAQGILYITVLVDTSIYKDIRTDIELA